MNSINKFVIPFFSTSFFVINPFLDVDKDTICYVGLLYFTYDCLMNCLNTQDMIYIPHHIVSGGAMVYGLLYLEKPSEIYLYRYVLSILESQSLSLQLRYFLKKMNLFSKQLDWLFFSYYVFARFVLIPFLAVLYIDDYYVLPLLTSVILMSVWWAVKWFNILTSKKRLKLSNYMY